MEIKLTTKAVLEFLETYKIKDIVHQVAFEGEQLIWHSCAEFEGETDVKKALRAIKLTNAALNNVLEEAPKKQADT